MNSKKIQNPVLDISKVFLNNLKILGQGVKFLHCVWGLFGRESQSRTFFLLSTIRISWTVGSIIFCHTYVENEPVSRNDYILTPGMHCIFAKKSVDCQRPQQHRDGFFVGISENEVFRLLRTSMDNISR
jgi:hypothetical protein